MNLITVNGEERALEKTMTVTRLVREFTGHDAPRGVAVAVNGSVVRRGTWAGTELHPGDVIEVLQAVAGG